jgi:hypothetical protein
MILYADFRTEESRMAFVPAKGVATWVKAKGRDASIGLLAKLENKVKGLRAKIRRVVLAEGSEHRAVTWSGVRAGVSFANALAFALEVPVAGIAVDGEWTPAQVTEKLRAMKAPAAKNGKRAWVRAHYVGDPNITVAKG